MSRRQVKSRTIAPIKVTVDARGTGRRIREIRGFGLTQVEFCRVLGISRAQLSKYELGYSAPTPEMLLKLKAFSGKSVDWILVGEEPAPEQ
jgi:transcriptional regulator with XRE-family HTH domain